MGLDFGRLVGDAERDGVEKFVVGAVVHDVGRVLILRRSAVDDFLPGIEELPSGGVDPGEDLFQALARELGEEIGWHRPIALDAGFVACFDYTTGSGRRARQFTFSLAHDSSPITLSAEHTALRWITPAEVDDTDLTPESRQVITTWTHHVPHTQNH
ncbi:NUDIX domain-containing protein [Spiractinospora alimapuensis]|uniref:NUDIX domain-containing protein n=1 Tax=Spiractinospora alimapuensis TaxID=2820884 RepID=UPI0022AA7754|nr:NUDIX domain-containing protein [Spiractinospora alimapuensis]QVQ54034.1 NUDIX domain-containing protein [Spiractinospora alimapuensis]